MNAILTQEYLDHLQKAVDTMNLFLDEVKDFRTGFVPSLYGPYSCAYDIYVTDGTQHVPMTIVNDGTKWEPWVPEVGGPIGDCWRHEVKRWADPDKTYVEQVSKRELEQVIRLRQVVESDSQTLEGLIEALTVEDVDSLRSGIQALRDSMIALNDVAPAVSQGVTHCEDAATYVDNNWVSESARVFRQTVGEMKDSFQNLYTAVDNMIDGDEALLVGMISFVTSIITVLDIRREEFQAMASNVLNGTLSLLGVVASPEEALAWVTLAVSVLSMAGSDDSEDRRKTMDEFQQHAISRSIRKALDTSRVLWPTFDSPGYDFP